MVFSDACVTWPCPVLPLRPQLTDFSVVVAVDVGIILDQYTDTDIGIISNIIGERFATSLDVPKTDIRSLSETRFQKTSISRFSMEVRVPSEQAGLVTKAHLKRSATEIAHDIQSTINNGNAGPIRSVKIITETLATIVDSVVKDPVTEPLTGSAVTGIVILCIILGSGAVGMGYFYFNPIAKSG